MKNLNHFFQSVALAKDSTTQHISSSIALAKDGSTQHLSPSIALAKDGSTQHISSSIAFAKDRNTQYPAPIIIHSICEGWQYPIPNIQHPAPSTQHPAPSTQHPAPSTQHHLKGRVNYKFLFLWGVAILFFFIQSKLSAQQMSLDLTPSLNAFGYNITCFGMQDGYIDLTINNGVGPFTIRWSNHDTIEDITGLAAGYYRVWVTDLNNNASTFAEITLIEPEPIFTSVHLFTSTYPNGFNVSCSSCLDGSIATSVEAGLSPFTFQWNDGETTQDRAAIHSGVYVVTVTGANGCASSEQIILTAPEREDWTAFGNSGSNPGIHFLGTIDSVDLVFKTKSIERLRILNNGNLKINSLAGSGNRALMVDGAGVLNVSPNPPTYWETTGNNTVNNVSFLGSKNGQDIIFKIGNPAVGITMKEIARFKSNGSIGIGTSNPSRTLEIVHNDGAGNVGGMVLKNSSTTNNNSEIEFKNSAGQLWAVGTDVSHNGGNDFFIWGGIAPSEKLYIDGAGRVGVGMVPPTSWANPLIPYKLYVADGIATRDVKVTAGNWPDYVFEKEHPLMTLYELENYIKQNKHLPDVKSADDVKKDEGFALGEMQIVLLRKIEEQTLYIIDLQKQVDELKAKIK